MSSQTWRRLLTVRESRVQSAERECRAAARAVAERQAQCDQAQADVMAAYADRCRVDEQWAVSRRSLETFSRDDCLAMAGMQERTQLVFERHMEARDGFRQELAAAQELERQARQRMRDIKVAARRTESVYERELAGERAIAAVHEEQELEELASKGPMIALTDPPVGQRA